MSKTFNYHIILFTSIFVFVSSPFLSQINSYSSDIPIIIITTDKPKDEYSLETVIARMIVINNSDDRNYITDNKNEYDGRISLRVRGNTSLEHPKKQYRIETQLENGDNNNVSLLGLPKENDWILSAPYADKSLIRNVLAYDLHRSLNHYAPRTKFCEVIINQDYKGIYVLTEKIKRDKNRLDISKLTSDEIDDKDLTGGYILKIDRPDTCSNWYTEFFNVAIKIEYPKCEDIANPQKEYIRKYINEFEVNLLQNENNYQYEYIDINSFIDFFIINELAKNIDAYRLSTYLYKDKNQKLNMGPVWDFNIAFGNVNYLEGYNTTGFIAQDINQEWWNHFISDSIFFQKLSDRWNDVRALELSNQRILEKIDSLNETIMESKTRNFARWQKLGEYVWPNYLTPETHEGEIRYLKSWIINRLNWMDIELKREIPTKGKPNYNMSIYPNPFTHFFTLNFTLTSQSNVSLKMFDPRGKLVMIIKENETYEPGDHTIIQTNFDNEKKISQSYFIFTLEIDGVIKNKIKVASIF